MQHRSPKTKLKDRTLWFDGDSVVPAENAVDMIQAGLPTGSLFVDEITDDIAAFNELVPTEEQIKLKTELRLITTVWNLPDWWRTMSASDIMSIIEERQETLRDERTAKLGKSHWDCICEDRINLEFRRFEQHGLLDVLRTLLYIINTLEEAGIPWGVGRGSSVASYILYLIGVHDVDSIEYELDFDEFLPPL